MRDNINDITNSTGNEINNTVKKKDSIKNNNSMLGITLTNEDIKILKSLCDESFNTKYNQIIKDIVTSINEDPSKIKKLIKFKSEY